MNACAEEVHATQVPRVLPRRPALRAPLGHVRTIRVEGVDWIREERGAGIFVHPRSGELTPDVLWVERAEKPRWARLTAIAEQEVAVSYGVIAEGTLDVAVTETTALLQDARGETAALFDPERGVLVGFDPLLGTWIRSAVPADALRARTSPATALIGATLFVAGGSSNGVLRADAHAIDVFGKQTLALSPQFPLRRGARLVPTTDGRALALIGGVDENGVPRDELWISELAGPRELAPAKKLATPGAAALAEAAAVDTHLEALAGGSETSTCRSNSSCEL